MPRLTNSRKRENTTNLEDLVQIWEHNLKLKVSSSWIRLESIAMVLEKQIKI